MVGLYDREGVLRCVSSGIEACIEYAALFQIPLDPCSLQQLPDPAMASVRIRGDRHLEGRSN